MKTVSTEIKDAVEKTEVVSTAEEKKKADKPKAESKEKADKPKEESKKKADKPKEEPKKKAEEPKQRKSRKITFSSGMYPILFIQYKYTLFLPIKQTLRLKVVTD